MTYQKFKKENIGLLLVNRKKIFDNNFENCFCQNKTRVNLQFGVILAEIMNELFSFFWEYLHFDQRSQFLIPSTLQVYSLMFH